jgi:hypothetical protein
MKYDYRLYHIDKQTNADDEISSFSTLKSAKKQRLHYVNKINVGRTRHYKKLMSIDEIIIKKMKARESFNMCLPV